MSHDTDLSRGVRLQELQKGLQRRIIDECEATRQYGTAMIDFAHTILGYLKSKEERAEYTPGETRMEKFFTEQILPAICATVETEAETLFIVAKLLEWAALSIVRRATATFVTEELARTP